MKLACSNSVTKKHLKLAVEQTSQDNNNAALIEFLLIIGMKQKQWEHGLPKDVIKEILQPFKKLKQLHANQELVVRLVDIHLIHFKLVKKVKPALNESQKDSWWPWGTTKDNTKVLYWSPLVAKIIDDGCADGDIRWCVNNTSWWVCHPSLPTLSINTIGRTNKKTLLDIYFNEADSSDIPELIMYQGGMTKDAFSAELQKRTKDRAYKNEVKPMNASVSLESNPTDTATKNGHKLCLDSKVETKEQVEKLFKTIIPLIATGKLRPKQKIGGESLLLLATKHGLDRERTLFLNYYAVPVEKAVFSVASEQKEANKMVLAGYKEKYQEKLKNPDCQENSSYKKELNAVKEVVNLRKKIQEEKEKSLCLKKIVDTQKANEASGDAISAPMKIIFKDQKSELLFKDGLKKSQKKKKAERFLPYMKD